MTGEDRAGQAGARSPDEMLAAAVVRIGKEHGGPGGTGFLVAPDLVLTCAHVVSDALGLPREETVALGTAVTVDFPLAGRTTETAAGRTDHAADGAGDAPARDGGPGPWPATVEHWVPVRADRTGDLAVLRLPSPVPGALPLPMADPESVWEHGARAVGFTGGAPGGTWLRGRLGGATSEGWLQLSRADGQAVHVKRGFSGSPVWDNELGAAVGLLVAAQPEQDAQQAYVIRTRSLVQEIDALAPALLPPSPFRGLAPFQESDAEIYFGRDADVEDVVTALHGGHTTVTVCGPSGCGKSSLALAGVVPRMRTAGYEVLVVNAGRISSPLAALATELYEAARSGRYGPVRPRDADQVEAWLTGKGLADTLHRVRGTADGRLVVVLDQAEALLDRPETEIDELARLLFPHGPRGPQASTDGEHRVLLTLRSDFMDAVLRHPRLGPVLRAGTTLPLTPMSPDQLEEVITKPVERIPAVAYEPGLDRRILADAGNQPGILPLLGFVLDRLWEQRTGGRLRTAAYEAMNGVSGALEMHAERAWSACIGDGKATEAEALRLLTGLVRVLPGSETPLRRRLTRQEAGEERWKIARALAERRWRLLVLHGGAGEPQTAELAHESLITSWPALRQQVKADSAFLAGRAELSHDRERWERGGRPPALLPGALQLLGIRRWLDGRESELTDDERDFLARARQRSRVLRARTRAAWIVGAVVLALVAGLGTFLHEQSRISAERAAEGRSRSLASLSDDTAKADPGLAALQAVAAYDTSPTQEARSALLRRYDTLKDAAWALTSLQGEVQGTATSTDGTVLLATSETGRPVLFLRRADGRILRKQLEVSGNAFAPMVSRDGRRIGYLLGSSGTPVWREVRRTADGIGVGPERRVHGGETGEFTLGAENGSYSVAAFSPQADRAAAVAADGRLRVWDLRTGRLRVLHERLPHLVQMWFGPDGDTVVAERRDSVTEVKNSLIVVDLRTGKVRELEGRRDRPTGAGVPQTAVSADGGVLAVCRTVPAPGDSLRAVYRAVRVKDGRELKRYTPTDSTGAPEGICDAPALDATGAHMAVDRNSGEWVVLRTRPGGKAQRFAGPSVSTERIGPLLWAPDRPVLVVTARSQVTGWSMDETDGATAYGTPKLFDHGKRLVVRLGERGERLRVAETEGRHRTVAEVRTHAKTPPDAKQELAVNHDEALVADVADHNRITVRSLPKLDEVAEFTTHLPPVLKQGTRQPVQFFFQHDELVTSSGGIVEHWNPRTGRRLTEPVDVHDLPGLRLGRTKAENIFVGAHPRPGYVQIGVYRRPTLHAVELRTGEEDKSLRIRIADDMVTAARDRSGRYALVLRSGGLVELWSVRQGQRPHKVLGPLGPLDGTKWQLGFLRDSAFFLANGHSVRFFDAADLGASTSYDFGTDQWFLASDDDGKALLRTSFDDMGLIQDARLDLVRLDPGAWKRHLCQVLGRDLSAAERDGMPSGLPPRICPAGTG